MERVTDIFIIGGGINGAGIAADAAGRGLTVTLCEKGDLASGTSSYSTKLIHGGLRYLEYYEFNLVRKALREREILLKKAPHLIAPLEFVLPYEKHLRPAWMIRLGLFLYDYLAPRKFIPGSRALNLTNNARGTPLQKKFTSGFSYYDCFTDDARLVIENAIDAKKNNATILTRTEFISAQREGNHWKIQLKNLITNQTYFCSAKALVNAAGPWVQHINNNIVKSETNFSLELVKGSHIVVPKLYEGDFAYILQNSDKRVIFTIPYQHSFTLIGTTDVIIDDIHKAEIDESEKKYLCGITNQYFTKSISPADIVWSFSGVRCLQNQHTDNPSKTTRDYKLLIESKNDVTPLLTVIGGKITTFRTLAEDCMDKLKEYFPQMGPSWTANKPLPGGNIENYNFKKFLEKIKKEFNWLPHELAHRYAKNYGTRIYLLLENIKSVKELGHDYGAGLYQNEIDYLIAHEWAITIDDILWRRTKLGLFISRENVEHLEKNMLALHPEKLS